MKAFWICAIAAIVYLAMVLLLPMTPLWKLLFIFAATAVSAMAYFGRRSDI